MGLKKSRQVIGKNFGGNKNGSILCLRFKHEFETDEDKMWEQLEKERKGISVSHGIIHYPKQKKLLEVELTEQDIDLIQDAIRKMEDIVRMDASPKVINKPYCKKCAYW